MSKRNKISSKSNDIGTKAGAKARSTLFQYEVLETRQLMSNSVLMPSAVEAKTIAKFETAITNEVEKLLSPDGSSVFQAHVAHQQSAFADRIAKAGGTYTPIGFDQLVATATTDKAQKLALKIGKEIAVFEARLTKLVVSSPKRWTNVRFQTAVANSQIKFAAHIAKEGGNYTPVVFPQLGTVRGGPDRSAPAASLPQH